MKLTAITFTAIFAVSLIIISVFNMIGSDGIFVAASAPKLSHEDSAKLLNNRVQMFKTAAAFDEQFYKTIAGEETAGNEAIRRVLREQVLKIKVEQLESPLLNELLFRADNYMRRAMESKARITSDALEENEFITAFDSIYYNYTASEAVLRIIDKVANIKQRGRHFISDEVSDTALTTSSCLAVSSDSHDYEGSLTWFISANALKSSFDVVYLQVLFGKPFYSKSELRQMNRRMGRLLTLMSRCTPPDVMGNALKNGYALSVQGYANKATLAGYRSFAVFQNESDVMSMIDSVYAVPNMSAAAARSVGYDAFQTLAMLTLFELYSQNYKMP